MSPEQLIGYVGICTPEDAWNQTLAAMSEGVQTTLGAYHRRWQ
nr:hypothetical protein [Candidatus Sodalis pierantonius]